MRIFDCAHGTRFAFREDLSDEILVSVFGDENRPVKVTAIDRGKASSVYTMSVPAEDLIEFGTYLVASALGRGTDGLTSDQDPELLEWVFGVLNGVPTPAGDFLRSIAEAARRADEENYPLLRPALLELKKKFPKYRDPDPHAVKSPS
jgi:hypothetical protein